MMWDGMTPYSSPYGEESILQSWYRWRNAAHVTVLFNQASFERAYGRARAKYARKLHMAALEYHR